MAILEHKSTESKNSLKKEIDESSAFMIYDALQSALYTKPIASAVRESSSNGFDAVKEKKMAISILKGECKESDYFEVSKDGSTNDSKFDRDYYDLKYLSNDNCLYIDYKENDSPSGRDEISFTDYGVGLGGGRLIGWTKLGYSTKRLNRNLLGGFGLGCKSPLATEIDSFRLNSRHNGKEYCLDVYSDRIISVFGKFNEDGTQNDFIPVLNKEGEVTFKIYYKTTEEKNMVKISFDVKKYQRNEFYDSIRQQLMYVKEEIKFIIHKSYGKQEQKVKSTIIYEDDNIIIAEDSYFSKPHFVINNVVYGLVDFRALELPERNASVGIKVSMEDVDVTPSRESIRYTQKTKETIIKKFELIESLITEKLSAELKTDDFFSWMNSVNAICSNQTSGNNVIVNKLGRLIDRSSLELSFNGIKGNLSISNFFGNFIRIQSIKTNWSSKLSKTTYSLSDNDFIFNVDVSKIVFYEGVLKGKAYFYKNGYVAVCENRSESNDAYFEILDDENLTLEDKEKACIALIKSEEKDLLSSDKDNNSLKLKIEKMKRSVRIHHFVMLSKNLKDISEFKISESDSDDDDDNNSVSVAKSAPKVKQKADRTKINITVPNGKDFKIAKCDLKDYNICYYLTSDNVTQILAKINPFILSNEMKIESFSCYSKDTTKMNSGVSYIQNGIKYLIAGIAPGNERYVPSEWIKLNTESFVLSGSKIEFTRYKSSIEAFYNYLKVYYNIIDICQKNNIEITNVTEYSLWFIVKAINEFIKKDSILKSRENIKILEPIGKWNLLSLISYFSSRNIDMSIAVVNNNIDIDYIADNLINSNNLIREPYSKSDDFKNCINNVINIVKYELQNKDLIIDNVKYDSHNLVFNVPESKIISDLLLLEHNDFGNIYAAADEISDKHIEEWKTFAKNVYNKILNKNPKEESEEEIEDSEPEPESEVESEVDSDTEDNSDKTVSEESEN